MKSCLYFSFLSSVMFCGLAYGACTPSPDCASLGYTATSCPNGGVKCPFDTSKWHCDKTKISANDICPILGYHGVSCDASCNLYANCVAERIGQIECVRISTMHIDGIGIKKDENGRLSCTLDCKSACLSLPPKDGSRYIPASYCKSDYYTTCGPSTNLIADCNCRTVTCFLPTTFDFGTLTCKQANK